ncbi:MULTISPECIES: MFS transporter [Curtobacterium]|jgi:DHA1 family inner membrane transport protein|uniref:MFS transporter n=1 Tax=Curtobacterium TaxID=2034 RepID=UPI000DA9AD2C|nr:MULTISPECIES: MFS transporter [Curtobacterium]MBT1683626.1 MFS transporter [Curtobacterium flaccumfaciens pv. flaccumfaciens]MCS0644702.1 MFS transporter [Curtobacterium flaccumfaciens pv. flaccumfaciens]MCS6527606.1 MFS transporter [Curtobacterium flaccumfaciens pv. flaccumfaciens]MCS6527938.1 MFS transporter [Curtobacterium flaccumfaciens pv. flaccumfaciens]MCS6546450.1 MFS transporter [Curtobacterium flaccumfaciens pv. flaccumfaciens]
MSQLTPARRTLALISLALGGFAIGSTEFVAMGLLPNIAQALLPEQYGIDPDAGIAHAGWLVSAYALGVVVGAPTIAAMSARFPRKGLILVLLVGFVVATIASALLPSFGLVLVARFVAGLPHGAYFGIASIVAGDMMGPGKRGKGIAMVLLGLSVANVVGVPAITWVGQVAGWRVAYGVVAALFALTFLAVAAFVPKSARDEHATIGRELRAFRVPQVWIVMGLGAVGFGGFFAVYSYISPLVQNVTGMPESFVPIVLVVVGIGMVVGGVLGGHLADHSVKRTIYVGMFSLIGALLITVLTAQWLWGMLLGAFLLGATSSAIPPAVQSRLMDVAGDARTIAAALNHSAFNIGNSIGAALGGAVIAAGFGFLAPGWLGIGLALLGVLVTMVSYAVERRSTRRAAVRSSSPSTGPITAPVPTA